MYTVLYFAFLFDNNLLSRFHINWKVRASYFQSLGSSQIPGDKVIKATSYDFNTCWEGKLHITSSFQSERRINWTILPIYSLLPHRYLVASSWIFSLNIWEHFQIVFSGAFSPTLHLSVHPLIQRPKSPVSAPWPSTRAKILDLEPGDPVRLQPVICL